MTFSDTCNVLMNLRKVKEYPFPYAGAFGCLPDDIYVDLIKTRPDWKAIVCGREIENNKRLDMPAYKLLESQSLAPIWREFVSYHTSTGFYHQILNHFEFYFHQFYGLNGMRDYKTAVRWTTDKADIYMDCQLSINTPVTVKSTVNHAHVDNPNELFASLLYMRDPEDTAGGDLVLHKCISPPTWHGKREADLDVIREVLRIPYAPNVYVAFVNSPFSIHSVTEREVTEKPRLMVNISLEFEGRKLFDV